MRKKDLVNDKADVSVIIPVYNSGKEAFRAVQFVLQQTLLPREVILVDDCSPNREETRYWLSQIVKKFSAYFNVIVLYQKNNAGPGEARNSGWNIAKGKYIAFLDSDDIWHPQKIEIQYNFMEKYPQVGFCCHHLSIIKESGIDKFKLTPIQITKNDLVMIKPVRYLFKHYPIGGTSYVMVKNVSNIRFLPGKRYSEDYLVWLEFCFRYGGALINKFMGASFKPFYGAGGLSKNLWNLETGELENYTILYKQGLISQRIYYMARIFSVIKFVRRFLVCALFKR